jgi:hypothetical protein
MDSLYYLRNFATVIGEVARRDADVLGSEERHFIQCFSALADAPRALLARMVMRKGALLRRDSLHYVEIGELEQALLPLAALNWVSQPSAWSSELFPLFSKLELCTALKLPIAWRGRPKPELERTLEAVGSESPTLEAQLNALCKEVVCLSIKPLCERFRALFFGNFHQEWHEFVLADLGVARFEPVPLAQGSRPFESRAEMQAFFELERCRALLEEPVNAIVAHQSLPGRIERSEWLEERRQRVLFEIAFSYERSGSLRRAHDLYDSCTYPDAKRRQRILTRRWGVAKPELDASPARACMALPKFEILIEGSSEGPRLGRIERRIRDRLRAEDDSSEVHYVENALINSIFGLLCWEAIFAPLPGAFFHAFHRAPADLESPSFHVRRERLFEACLAQLDSEEYRSSILGNFRRKFGIASPFVSWRMSQSLIESALLCFPPRHLELWCRWILRNVRENRAGFPDLVQLWPRRGEYRLIEVKGPGDQLQPNQRRCLEYCHSHRMPVSICRVRDAGR